MIEIKLNSVVSYGVGGPEAGAICLIYEFLLVEFSQDIFRYIGINQIGNDLDEVILKQGNKININIRFVTHPDFDTKSPNEKNIIRLDIIHEALLKISNRYNRFNLEKLAGIRDLILKNDFSFEFVCKAFPLKKKGLIAKIIVRPEVDRFMFFVSIEMEESQLCKVLVFEGLTSMFYFSALFSVGKWENDNLFVLSGKEKQMNIQISVKECVVSFINLTSFSSPPYFDMMKSTASLEERRVAFKNWEFSTF